MQDFNLNRNPTLEDVQTSALMRIADSMEIMAKEYNRLISDRNYFEKRVKLLTEENEKLSNTLRAVKGHNTRLKRMNHKNTEL